MSTKILKVIQRTISDIPEESFVRVLTYDGDFVDLPLPKYERAVAAGGVLEEA